MGIRRGSFLLGLYFLSLVLVASIVPPENYAFPSLRGFPAMPQDTDNPVTTEGAALGRYLFYDPILSFDRSMSCATCHQQMYAFAAGPVRFSLDRHGNNLKRNTMPLFNLAWYPAFFWDGRAASIENQVYEPVSHPDEMNLAWKEVVMRLSADTFYLTQFQRVFGPVSIDSTHVAKAMGQFLRTLLSYQSKYDRVLAGQDYFTSQEFRGFVLANEMDKGDCLQCHSTDSDALGTNRNFSNNGLDHAVNPEDYPDTGRGKVTGLAADFGKFKTPSLRNLAFTSPYMHDGRFNTLEEVLDFYSEGVREGLNTDSRMATAHQGGVRLSTEEKADLLAFLLTLTDSVFVSKPEFSNPFMP